MAANPELKALLAGISLESLKDHAKALLAGISLESLKDHAKALRRDAKAGESDARQRIEPCFDDPSTLKLQQAQLVIARERGFKSWRRLKSFIEVRDARTEAQRAFVSISTRMAPDESLMEEHQAASAESSD